MVVVLVGARFAYPDRGFGGDTRGCGTILPAAAGSDSLGSTGRRAEFFSDRPASGTVLALRFDAAPSQESRPSAAAVCRIPARPSRVPAGDSGLAGFQLGLPGRVASIAWAGWVGRVHRMDSARGALRSLRASFCVRVSIYIRGFRITGPGGAGRGRANCLLPH